MFWQNFLKLNSNEVLLTSSWLRGTSEGPWDFSKRDIKLHGFIWHVKLHGKYCWRSNGSSQVILYGWCYLYRCTRNYKKHKPSWLDFCYPDVLKTWQQSNPKLGVKNEWTIAIIKESGLWEIQRWPLGFFQFPDKPLFFFWWVKAFPGHRVNALIMKKNMFHWILSLLIVKLSF